MAKKKITSEDLNKLFSGDSRIKEFKPALTTIVTAINQMKPLNVYVTFKKSRKEGLIYLYGRTHEIALNFFINDNNDLSVEGASVEKVEIETEGGLVPRYYHDADLFVTINSNTDKTDIERVIKFVRDYLNK